MRRFFLISTVALYCTLVSCAAETEQIPTASQTETSATHPFYEDVLYPAWSSLTPAQALIDVRSAVELAKERQQRIRELKPEEATYENVFAAYENMYSELERAEALIGHLSSVMDSDELRAAQEELIPELSSYMSSITSDSELWHVIKSAAAAPWVKELSPEKQRYVRQLVDYFHDSGADLDTEQKARLSEIAQELSQLTHQFDKYVLDATNAWQWVIEDPSLLAGMSDSWMRRAAADALSRGIGSEQEPRWLVTLDDTSAREVLWYCDVESTRKTCWEAINAVCTAEPYDTAGIIARIMELRGELATLLGFKNFADLNLAHRMAGSGTRAMAFIDDMMAKIKPAYDAEMQDLREFVARCKNDAIADKLQPWDIPYYTRKLAKERYDFDPEILRPYQEFSHVLQGMFSIYQHLYGIRISELPVCCPEPGETCPENAVEVWHPEVKAFAVCDEKTGAHLGSFYMDIFPRSTKRSGAWVNPLHFGDPAHDGLPHKPHLAVLAGNLSPAAGDHPALFSHTDVETLFHEFGHMMHVMLGDTELRSHCGTSVAWDFVELPSQMNENWTWEPEGIASYAVHYETGEPLSQEIIRKLINSRYSFPAASNMGQLFVAKIDMEAHTRYDDIFRGRDLDEATNDILQDWRTPTTEPYASILRQLSHCISGGYAAGYYSYKWAEVLAADVFTRFEKEGILNPATGAAYRDTILSKGDSKPAGELYRDFMGRDPNPDALLQKEGLLEK